MVYNGVFVGAIIQLKLSLGNTLHSTNHSPPPGVCRVQVHVSEHVMLMRSLFCSTLSTVSALSNFPLVLFLYPLTLSSQSSKDRLTDRRTRHVVDLCIWGLFVYRYIHRVPHIFMCAGEAEKVYFTHTGLRKKRSSVRKNILFR